MSKCLLIATFFTASLVPPAAPALAKGRPQPVVWDCRDDISGDKVCAFDTLEQCRAGMRELRRAGYTPYGCIYVTGDPPLWSDGRYVLQYDPEST